MAAITVTRIERRRLPTATSPTPANSTGRASTPSTLIPLASTKDSQNWRSGAPPPAASTPRYAQGHRASPSPAATASTRLQMTPIRVTRMRS
jgi:hypothetical protein